MYERTLSGALGPYFAQIKQIGAGGNGRVLSAIDTRFDFPVCIKRVSVANKDECRATLREIRIRRRLQHENMVGLLNAVVSDGTDVSQISPANFRDTSCIYLVQELLDADLRQVIENTRLSDEYIKLFFYQLLRGLKYIHSANVLHRDLKPSNIMVNVNSLQLMIGDFGHSKVLDPEYNHESSQTICATSLWYKAPELILGTAQYSTGSDIWAAGCILAEMLSGRPLFEGENDLEQLELIIHAIEVDPKDQVYIREYLPEKANTMYSGKPKFPLQSKFQKADSQAVHLLEHLLSFNADDRVTTELALSHPFLSEYSCVADEPVCLKPLHLEHEVDDFLEYTLKDLIVGECVALAEEQPRIHLQMSSYCSLTDITKDCNKSPCESSSQSVDDSRGLIFIEDYSEMSNENEGNRFKVLEVLKEEHGSSSDSNGLATHEEGISEEPLVSDHLVLNSSRFEKERHHKSSHRSRHHSHHKSRRRKTSREEKHQLRSPSVEFEPLCDTTHSPRGSLPEILLPVDCVARVNSPANELPGRVSPMVEIKPPITTVDDPAGNPESTADDKVQELIMRSRQLIADQTAVMNGVPTITDVCSSVASKVDVPSETDDNRVKPECLASPSVLSKLSHHSSLNQLNSPKTGDFTKLSHHRSEAELEMFDGLNIQNDVTSSSVGDLTKLNQHKSSVDLGVAEVIRKSQELLGGFNVAEGKCCITGDVKPEIASIPEHSPCVPDEKNCGSADVENDSYNYSPPFTERLLKPISLSPQVNVQQPFYSEANDKGDDSLITHSFDPNVTPNTLQPMLSDPYLLKQSKRRMQELLAESHTLLNSLKTDQAFIAENDSGALLKNKTEQKSYEEKEGEMFDQTKRNFDQSLDGIDLREMKLVLDQAKKLVEKPHELSASDDLNTETSVDGMEVVENTNDSGTDEEQCMEVDVQCCEGNKTEIMPEHDNFDVKEVTCLQNQCDLVHAMTEPPCLHATVFEVIHDTKFIPLLKERTLCLNSQLRKYEDNKATNMTEKESDSMHQDESDNVFENSDFQIDNEALVKKRSSDTISEVSEDHASHKHFENCCNLTTVNSAEENLMEINREHYVGDSELRLNEIKTLDLNADERLLANANCKVDIDKVGKHSPKYETATLRNGDAYSNGVIDDDVVDKLYGTTCGVKSNTKRLNLKDSAGLQNFYATLKIKSIMRNHGRSSREKRHDTYPF